LPRFPRSWMKKLLTSKYHTPVLLQEAINTLAVKAGQWYLDATVGGGGHTAEIIKAGGRVLGIDQDKEAIAAAKEYLSLTSPGAPWQLTKGNFSDLEALVEKEAVGPIAGVIFDLGFSSHQLAGSGRGFSFSRDEELDMRMDLERQNVKAKDLLVALSEKELYEIFKKFADEQLARPIARCIVRARRSQPIVTTTQLRRLISSVYARAGKSHGRIDPATKVFQALRICVNDELNNLIKGLDQAYQLIGEGGRIVVISFHSGEDRIVKTTFKRWVEESKGRLVNKRPIVPETEEIRLNPRARSARLRGFEKI